MTAIAGAAEVRHDDVPVVVPAAPAVPVAPAVPAAPAAAARSASARHSSAEHSHPPEGNLLEAFRAFESLVGEPEVPAGSTDAAADGPITGEAGLAHTARILVVAERAAIFVAAALSGCAMVAARFGGLRIHPLSVAGWGAAACIAAVCLAAVATDRTRVGPGQARRIAVNVALLVAMLGSLTGVVAAADGVAGPAWVLFLPVVVIAGAVGGAVPGLLTGAGAAAGTYAAAALAHTLTLTGDGRLVVLLPVFPGIGLATGALCGAAHRAAREARAQQAALQADVVALSDLLEAVASGDLAAPPTLPASLSGGDRGWSDPATEGLAVVLADTLVALRRLVAQLSGTGEQVLAAADELAKTASVHVEAVETQAVAVAETTSTVEQLAATAVAIADTAARVSQCAADSRSDVDDGVTAVTLAAGAAATLARRTAGLADHAASLQAAVERIGAATKVMDELSRRTSMLALSAAIEAAATHEHATGFGNVAKEVRSLAEGARAATARIADIVGQLRAEIAATAAAAEQGTLAVAEGVARQHDVEAALARIRHMIDLTGDAAAEIGEATRQQRLAADAVVQAMASVEAASTVARVATARHRESADRLRELASEVRDTIARFRLPQPRRRTPAAAGPAAASPTAASPTTPAAEAVAA